MSPSRLPPDSTPPRPPTPGLERIVALALLAMAGVLGLVYLDLLRAPPPAPPTPFDWQNPLLFAQPGQCVEVGNTSSPGDAAWLVVRAPGVVLRPWSGPDRLAGLDPGTAADPRHFPPYLVCEGRRAPMAPAGPGGAAALPPTKDSTYIFPLNGFGMILESTCVLRNISPALVNWNGQTRRAHSVELYRYDAMVEGPWWIYMSRDAPVLGTMMREYIGPRRDKLSQTFRVAEGCR